MNAARSRQRNSSPPRRASDSTRSSSVPIAPSWPALASWLQVHEECVEKEAMGLWAPTQYNENQRRKNDNAVSLWAVVFDFDGREPE